MHSPSAARSGRCWPSRLLVGWFMLLAEPPLSVECRRLRRIRLSILLVIIWKGGPAYFAWPGHGVDTWGNFGEKVGRVSPMPLQRHSGVCFSYPLFFKGFAACLRYEPNVARCQTNKVQDLVPLTGVQVRFLSSAL